jgi:hypothetical protein
MKDTSLLGEVRGLTDRIHDLLAATTKGKDRSTRRIVQYVPDEWMLLAAWLEVRRRMRMDGGHGPSPLKIDDPNDRLIRGLARRYISFVLNDHFHLELHHLATGDHPFLIAPPEYSRPVVDDRLDDDLPF